MAGRKWNRSYESDEDKQRGAALEPFAQYWAKDFVGGYEGARSGYVWRGTGCRFWWFVIQRNSDGNLSPNRTPSAQGYAATYVDARRAVERAIAELEQPHILARAGSR